MFYTYLFISNRVCGKKALEFNSGLTRFLIGLKLLYIVLMFYLQLIAKKSNINNDFNIEFNNFFCGL